MIRPHMHATRLRNAVGALYAMSIMCLVCLIYLMCLMRLLCVSACLRPMRLVLSKAVISITDRRTAVISFRRHVTHDTCTITMRVPYSISRPIH